MTADTIQVLKCSDLFEGLNDQELLLLAEFTKVRKVGKNTLLINEGDESGSMYFIKEGSVNVTVANEDGKEMILTSLHQGDHFGELSLLDSEPRSTNILTTEKCEFIVINRNDFYRLLEKNSTLAINVIKYLCSQIRHITKNVESLALMDVYGRLVKLLVDLAVPTSTGERVVEMPLTHRDIALRIGSSREMISRILKELEKGEYLTIENKVITIRKKLPLAW